jgi:hypothetical protein
MLNDCEFHQFLLGQIFIFDCSRQNGLIWFIVSSHSALSLMQQLQITRLCFELLSCLWTLTTIRQYYASGLFESIPPPRSTNIKYRKKKPTVLSGKFLMIDF